MQLNPAEIGELIKSRIKNLDGIQFERQGIGPGRQRRNTPVACTAADRLLRDSGLRAGRHDGDPRENRAARVGHGPGQRPRRTPLCLRGYWCH